MALLHEPETHSSAIEPAFAEIQWIARAAPAMIGGTRNRLPGVAMVWNSDVVDSEILAVHAALVPNQGVGEVILFGGDEHWRGQEESTGKFRKTRLYDVATHSLVDPDPPIPSPDSDVFCAHHAFVTDGRLLVAGGTQKWPESDDVHVHDLDFLGHRRCWVYNHRQRNWREVARLNTNPDQSDEEHSGGRWYPGLISLGNGDALAMFGHLDQQDTRHRNTLPERYNQGANAWINVPKVAGTVGEPNSGGRRFLFFPRGFVMPDGNVFFATPMPADFTATNEGAHFSTAYNVATGDYVAPKIAAPGTGAYNGWDRPCVLLPLLPGEEYAMHLVHVGGTSPVRLDLDDTTPAWNDTAARPAALSTRDRRFANAVLLPTGEVCVVGGVADAGNERPQDGPVRPEDPVNETELYDPGINWAAGTYGGTDSWTLKEAGQFARNYHSTALLLPNGKVWVAGGNFNAGSGNPDADVEVGGVTKKRATKKIELYEPDYIAVANRLQVTSAPKFVRYRQEFTVDLDRAATQVAHASLIRCGSVTHSTNNDQRFVSLVIDSRSGDSITLVAPPSGNVAPPGYYMLWLVDTAGNPCVEAPFVRMAPVSCTVVTDRSTFSKEEVEALGGGGQATFTNALYVHYDGFIHTELTATPTVALTWVDDGSAIDSADLTLVPAGRLQEIEPGFADAAQRITYPFHVRFHNLDTFLGFTDRRLVRATFSVGGLTCTETIDLTYAPNPYMIDIDPAENNPAWLSTDVRVFPMLTGQSKFGSVQQDDQPIQFIRGCLDALNNSSNNGSAMFDSLSTSAKLDLWTSYPWPVNLDVYNYAIARVRYRATATTAQKVKCFFRMFNVAATALHFDANRGYRSTAPGPSTVPLLGVAGGEIVSMPFFASDRVETVTGQAGAAAMTLQSLNTTYEVLDIVPQSSGAEVTVYFGCWLDINQTRKRFPLEPGASDGPWPESSCRSVQELVRGEHMCLAAEIFFQPDPIAGGETPGTSDNLSQRNLAILHSDNPGSADSRTVMHTFEVKPSETPAIQNLAGGLEASSKRIGPDELLIRWHNLPRDSEVTIHFSDINTAEIQALAALRQSPVAFDVVSSNTIKLRVAGATWIPIPGGRALNIPALLTLRLPEGVIDGQEFHISIHQVAGRTQHVLGSCEFRIPISTAALIVEDTARTLSVFKHILSTIPPTNRWHPLIQRYVHGLGLKLDGLGGSAADTQGNPDGSGRPYEPQTDPRPGRPWCKPWRPAPPDWCRCLLAGAGAVVVWKAFTGLLRCLCRPACWRRK